MAYGLGEFPNDMQVSTVGQESAPCRTEALRQELSQRLHELLETRNKLIEICVRVGVTMTPRDEVKEAKEPEPPSHATLTGCEELNTRISDVHKELMCIVDDMQQL